MFGGTIYGGYTVYTLDVHIMARNFMAVKIMVVKNMVTFLKNHQILTTKLVGLFFRSPDFTKMFPIFDIILSNNCLKIAKHQTLNK